MLPFQNLSSIDLPGEIWKEVPNYGGRYLISSFGRLKTRRGVMKKQHINRYGYLVSTLYDGSGYSYPTIHKIVATVFLDGLSNDRNEIDHIDGNRLNNQYENLKWATRKENMNNPNTKSVLKKRKGPNCGKFGRLHPRSKAIYAIGEN